MIAAGFHRWLRRVLGGGRGLPDARSGSTQLDSARLTLPHSGWPAGLQVSGLPLAHGVVGPCAEAPDGRRTGLDLLAERGSPVLSIADGVVVFSGVKGGYGLCVAVLHADGRVCRYAHLGGRHVKVDDEVVRGQQIGVVGSTGNAMEPCLHLDVIWRRRYCDPMDYLLATGCLCEAVSEPVVSAAAA